MLPRDLIASVKLRWVRWVLGWGAPELIEQIYLGLLGRMPDPREAALSSAELTLHRDLPAVLKPIHESEEFQKRICIARVPGTVKAAYRALLGREPDPGGERTYTAFLAETGDLQRLISALSGSAEFTQRELGRLAPDFIDAAYRQLLGRAPDPAELAGDIANLAAEGNVAPLLRRLVHSEEFQRNLDQFAQEELARRGQGLECPVCGSLSNEDFIFRPVTIPWIRLAFRLILGRPATDADVDLQLRAESVGALRKALLRSEEFRQEMTNLFPPKLPTTEDLDATKTIFVHILKTGGTTMREMLKPAFGHDRTCPEHFNGLHCYTAGGLARFRLFAGHFSLQSCDLIPGPKQIFTLLRHPVKLLISFYNFARAHSEEIIARDEFWLAGLARGQADMRGFFSLEEVRRHPLMNNSMVRLLSKSLSVDPWETNARIEADSDAMAMLPAAKEALRSLTAFGILERYDESVEVIFRSLGLPAPARIERKNVMEDIAGKVKGIERVEPQACGPESLEVLAPLVEADLLLYQYAVELFEENIKNLRGR
jgi:hypothetical protein